MGIGNRIRELRISKKLSQGKLGELLSLSQDTISLWENEKSFPSIHDVIKLTRIFRVTSDFILGLED